MGKSSRRQRRARLDRSNGKQHRAALKADVRGAAVPPTVHAYEIAAQSGPAPVKEALVARHNARMVNFAVDHHINFSGIRSVIGPIAHADMAMIRLGANQARHPGDPFGDASTFKQSWANHIHWGLDSVIAAARLAFAGQLVGAALIIRQQLERWTENLAHNTRTAHRAREERAQYIQRAWDAENESFARAGTSRRSAASVNPLSPWSSKRAGAVFAELSEFLHGRGTLVGAIHWDAAALLSAPAHPDVSTAVDRAYRLIAEACVLVVWRLRVCVQTLARELGRPEEGRIVSLLPASAPAGAHRPPPWSLWPLMPETGLSHENQARYRNAEAVFGMVRSGERPAGRLFRDDEFADAYFLETRARSASTAVAAFEFEAAHLGDSFNLDSVSGRELLYVLASEISGLTALWNSGTSLGDAAATACTALRSAYWLWLEDDDRAMGMLRVVLEQVARMRTWRLKEEKARALEANPNCTPRDWLEESGLRRLSALNWALGEMAHFRTSVDWPGAREALIRLQLDYEEQELPELRGRGWTLDQAAFLLYCEAAEVVGGSSKDVQRVLELLYSSSGEEFEQAKRRQEAIMARVWEMRRSRYSVAPFSGPAEEYSRLWKLFGKGTDDPISPETVSFHSPLLSRPMNEDETLRGDHE